jgi:ABC-type antimicrobial peptide transport system permease subunit
VPGLRAAVRAVDPALALFEVTTAEGALAASLEQRRFTLLLLAGFAVVALLLATLGVYGVVSHSVSARTREVGVRMALGADARHVFRLVVREGMALAVAAVVPGGLVALVLGRLVAPLLFGVEPRDPATFAVVTLVLLAAAFVASALPAARAVRLDPAPTLRAE